MRSALSANHLHLVTSFPEPKRQKKPRDDAWRMNAVQRRRELRRLARYRAMNGVALGSEAGWADAIADALRAIYGRVTVQMVLEEWGAYGLPSLSPQIVEDRVQRMGWGRRAILKPCTVGSALEVTSVEREEAGIFKIEAADEPADERRKRLDRERKRRQRAAKAALAPKPMTRKDLAKSLGISRAELYRRIKSGEVQP